MVEKKTSLDSNDFVEKKLNEKNSEKSQVPRNLCM